MGWGRQICRRAAGSPARCDTFRCQRFGRPRFGRPRFGRPRFERLCVQRLDHRRLDHGRFSTADSAVAAEISGGGSGSRSGAGSRSRSGWAAGSAEATAAWVCGSPEATAPATAPATETRPTNGIRSVRLRGRLRCGSSTRRRPPAAAATRPRGGPRPCRASRRPRVGSRRRSPAMPATDRESPPDCPDVPSRRRFRAAGTDRVRPASCTAAQPRQVPAAGTIPRWPSSAGKTARRYPRPPRPTVRIRSPDPPV
jgi:hypothetical protein